MALVLSATRSAENDDMAEARSHYEQCVSESVPWPHASDGATKLGSLSKWNWRGMSETEATYQGNKILEDGLWDTSTKRAAPPNKWLQRTQQRVINLACASLPPPCRAAEPRR